MLATGAREIRQCIRHIMREHECMYTMGMHRRTVHAPTFLNSLLSQYNLIYRVFLLNVIVIIDLCMIIISTQR